jgi:FAD/FMN-containing dehydrogenase
MSDLSPLKEFLSQHPHIHHAIPSSPDYTSLSSIFCINSTSHPLMVVRPQSADDVAGLVSIFSSHSIPFTVRVGGHDMFNRSIADNSVTIDLRDISYVNIDKASSSARVGGGVISKDLVEPLANEGLVTPTGTINTVGYTGWAIYGGYGILSSNYGLGVDQILGAKVVNAEGKIVDADEKLLKGIRGGGGAFGVIVELTIKVYPSTSVCVAPTFQSKRVKHVLKIQDVSDKKVDRFSEVSSSSNRMILAQLSSNSMTESALSLKKDFRHLLASIKHS